MEVLLAKDGLDAVGQLQDHRPDVVLLDIEMPRMDGFELARHVRDDSRLHDVPIMMITSRSGDKHREHARKLGVNRYLIKPYQEANMVRNVFEMLDMPVPGVEE
jgi:chemosensory pili system protein ChpA (sensor histidine kinase/response regulator)